MPYKVLVTSPRGMLFWPFVAVVGLLTVKICYGSYFEKEDAYHDTYCDGSSAFTTSLFALPTIVNGYVYVPNSGISQVPSTSHAASTCNTSPGCSGVLVYSGH